MFVATRYVSKRLIHVFHLWLNELGLLKGLNGGRGGRSTLVAIWSLQRDR